MRVPPGLGEPEEATSKAATWGPSQGCSQPMSTRCGVPGPTLGGNRSSTKRGVRPRSSGVGLDVPPSPSRGGKLQAFAAVGRDFSPDLRGQIA